MTILSREEIEKSKHFLLTAEQYRNKSPTFREDLLEEFIVKRKNLVDANQRKIDSAVVIEETGKILHNIFTGEPFADIRVFFRDGRKEDPGEFLEKCQNILEWQIRNLEVEYGLRELKHKKSPERHSNQKPDEQSIDNYEVDE